MPGLVAFGRRWSIGSDDLLVPSFIMFAFHIIWIIVVATALAIDFGDQQTWPKAVCHIQILGLLSTIFILILFSAILEICLTAVSLRGTILNDAPRSSIPCLLYIRLSVLILEIIWSIVATIWSRSSYFECDLHMTKQAMIGLVMWVWLNMLSALMTVWCAYDVAGRSWVKMKRYQANVRVAEHRHPSFRRSGSTQRNWRQRKVMRKYESSWNNRCRFLFCCVNSSETSRDSFGDLAKLLSEFFRDLDVVPSDIIVGLMLLRRLQRLEQVTVINEKRNNTFQFLSGIAITPNTKFVSMNNAQDLEAYQNVVYYMRYASAAYGWLWYVIPNGFGGLFHLCSNVRCCFHRYLCRTLGHELSERVVEDNCCFCNVAVIPTMFDPGSFEIVYASYHVDVGVTPFFVVVDYEKEAIVVSIRGTLSLKDLMTDLNAEAEPLPLDPVREDWLGHKGMVQAAAYLKSKLLGEHILDKAFEMCQNRSNKVFHIVIVGHSLGGGTAAILAILLREQFPDLVCFAFSPPGGLLSMPAVEYTKEFVTSVIVGKDVVPRIGLSQMEALRADLLNVIKKSHAPKWKTIMSGMKCCQCLRGSEFKSHDLNSSAFVSVNDSSSSASQRSGQDDRGLLSPNDSMVSMTMHQPLYPPGRIMHVVRHHPKKDEIKYESIWRRLIGKGEPVFQAIWAENTDYDEVLISPGMIQDHMPNNVLKALSRVSTSLGPAKPQRSLANNPSPLNLTHESSGVGDVIESSSKIHSEASFTSEQYPPYHNHWNQPKPPVLVDCSFVKNATPATVAEATEEMEACDDYISLAGSHSTETLFSLKINWDAFKELGKHPLEFPSKSRTGDSSSGSSVTSEFGTTLNELFGPPKFYKGSIPLASSETLSEVSSISMSSKASFIRDRSSPLTKVKLVKNLSLRHNGGYSNGNGKTHQRSLSCVYPEGKKHDNGIDENPYGTLNGANRSNHPEKVHGYGSLVHQDSLSVSDQIDEDYSANEKGSHEYANNETDPDRTPMDERPPNYFPDPELQESVVMGESEEMYPVAQGNDFSIDEEDLHANGDTMESEESPRTYEEFAMRKGWQTRDEAVREYSSVYPLFSHQQEYGREQQPGYPHYHYSTQSQQGSSTSIQSHADSPL